MPSPRTSLLLLLSVLFSAGAGAAEPALGRQPAAVVASVVESAHLDLVLFTGDPGHGIRRGMLLEVAPDGQPVAELIVIEARRAGGAALITRLDGAAPLAPGDSLRIKTRTSTLFS